MEVYFVTVTGIVAQIAATAATATCSVIGLPWSPCVKLRLELIAAVSKS